LGVDVERNFSAVGRFLTGLLAPKTHEARCQDLGNFGKVRSGRFGSHVVQGGCAN
jgi:hypothetical protein